MFGNYLVESYVGELKVASFVDAFLQATDKNHVEDKDDADSEESIRVWKQERRALDIVHHLRARMEKYVNGLQSDAECQTSCNLEAILIAKGDYGDSFLFSIGRSLFVEENIYVGKHTSELGLQGAAASIRPTTCDVIEGFQSVLILVQSVVSSAGPVMKVFLADSKRQKKEHSSFDNNDSGGTKNCGNDHDLTFDTMVFLEKLERSIPQAVRFVWLLNDRDIRQTLKEATNRLLRDGASLYMRLMRARGLVILGSEFYLR